MIGFLTAEMAMLISTPITLVLLLLEILYSVKFEKQYYTAKDTKQNVFLAFGYFIIDTLSKGVGLIFLGFFYYCGFHFAPNQTIWYWISLVLLQDFSYWFMHLMDHRIRLLWAGHIHHHSSKEFNLSVGIRSAVFEPIEKFLFFAPLAFVGFRPIDIVLIYILTQGWGTFLHTRTIKKLGFLEYFLTTPSHHRVHHGRNAKYVDRNYGMFLIIWDKMFGTFEKEDPNEPVEFGLVKNVDYKNYFDIILHEYNNISVDARQPIPFREKLKYIFGPPGYSHDGSRKTSKQLREEFERKNGTHPSDSENS